MVTAAPRPYRQRLTAILVTGTAALLLGALSVPAPAGASPNAGGPLDQVAAADGVPARLPAALRTTAPGSNGVPNPIEELPRSPSAGGPLGAADRDLVVKVRLAGLWEMPASKMATEKGSSPRVREIGVEIGKQHARLDELARAAAAKLNIPLPDEPTAEQQGWLGEMRRASGADFDRVYVDRLRAAHGKIFPAIATVRSGTRNDIVRELAAQANAFVLTHLTLLESTGLVAYDALPQPPPPAPAAAAAAAVGGGSLFDPRANAGGVDPTVVWIVLAAALIAGAYSTVRLIRAR
ncbi:DUF4142 domain-containing protein [Micromonospora sp. NPDC049559]|uniref:DUF4142 domain-containing protein n=1 Tax=Micromonospora sp. NPDC049559 TaxID=3155923 RepID=UPI00341E109C